MAAAVTFPAQASLARSASARRETSAAVGDDRSGLEHLDRVLSTFESYCTVTQSVGQGIPIALKVLDAQGVVLK